MADQTADDLHLILTSHKSDLTLSGPVFRQLDARCRAGDLPSEWWKACMDEEGLDAYAHARVKVLEAANERLRKLARLARHDIACKYCPYSHWECTCDYEEAQAAEAAHGDLEE